MVDVGTLTFAFLSGVLAFFSPCAFPLLPAYITYYLGMESDQGKTKEAKKEISKGLIGGFVCALGAIVLLMGLGVSISLVGEIISAYIGIIEPIVGVILLILGVLLLTGKGFSFGIKTSVKKKGYRSLFGYGMLYSLAGSGCVAPLFIGLILEAISQSFFEGLLTFVFYAFGISVLLVVVTVLVASAKTLLIQKMKNVTHYTKILAGIVSIGAGIYLITQFFLVF